jgi:hypothetical protein
VTWTQWFLLLGIMTVYVTGLSFLWEAYFGRRAQEEVGEHDLGATTEQEQQHDQASPRH